MPWHAVNASSCCYHTPITHSHAVLGAPPPRHPSPDPLMVAACGRTPTNACTLPPSPLSNLQARRRYREESSKAGVERQAQGEIVPRSSAPCSPAAPRRRRSRGSRASTSPCPRRRWGRAAGGARRAGDHGSRCRFENALATGSSAARPVCASDGIGGCLAASHPPEAAAWQRGCLPYVMGAQAPVRPHTRSLKHDVHRPTPPRLSRRRSRRPRRGPPRRSRMG
jgi:hypothetical protein